MNKSVENEIEVAGVSKETSGLVDTSSIREQLARILESDDFSSSPRLGVFLSYVVNEVLEGNGASLKAYSIATQAYKKPASFKTQDPYIRNIARGVRAALEKYYLKDGSIDPIHIEIPTGRYEPKISYRRTFPATATLISSSEASGVEAARRLTELKPTVGIIPFSILNGDQQDMFGEILADNIITGLSHSAELNVISRLSTTVFRGRDFSLASIGQHLNADYIVSGSYQINNGQFQLTIELCTVGDGRVVWADAYSGTIETASHMTAPLCQEVINRIGERIVGNEIFRSLRDTPASLETYSLMISAIRLMHRESRSDFIRAKKLLQVVIDRQINSSTPNAWLAKWHVLEFNRGWNTNHQSIAENAIACTQEALAADSHCSLALTIDGFVHTNILKDLDTGNARYEQALELNPNESLAWLLKGTLNAFKGNGEAALEETTKARTLSPLDPLKYYYESLSATAALSAEEYEAAIQLAKSSLRINKTHTSTLRALAIAQSELGQLDDAKSTVASILKLDPTLTVKNYLERSPSRDYSIGEKWSNALGRAGLPG